MVILMPFIDNLASVWIKLALFYHRKLTLFLHFLFFHDLPLCDNNSYMPGIILSSLCTYTHIMLWITYEIGTILPISPTRKLRPGLKEPATVSDLRFEPRLLPLYCTLDTKEIHGNCTLQWSELLFWYYLQHHCLTVWKICTKYRDT